MRDASEAATLQLIGGPTALIEYGSAAPETEVATRTAATIARPLSFTARTLAFAPSGEVAQLVEHTTENRGVASSILALAIFRNAECGVLRALLLLHGQLKGQQRSAPCRYLARPSIGTAGVGHVPHVSGVGTARTRRSGVHATHVCPPDRRRSRRYGVHGWGFHREPRKAANRRDPQGHRQPGHPK